ncbi:MAG: hypothetical protein OXQ29_06650 [Rhodospirillaceae bacterium]|nr:hypothetical protein [Rhodospirillaceae bacterium]
MDEVIDLFMALHWAVQVAVVLVAIPAALIALNVLAALSGAAVLAAVGFVVVVAAGMGALKDWAVVVADKLKWKWTKG